MNCVFPVEMQLELLIVLWCVKFTKVFSAFLMHHSYLQYLIIFYHQQSAAKKKKKMVKIKIWFLIWSPDGYFCPVVVTVYEF